MKDATLTVAGDDYAAAVRSVTFTPSAQFHTNRDLAGRYHSRLLAVAWSCRLGLLQDLTASSLHRYLLAHAGDAVTATFTPKAGGVSVTAELVLAPADIGGTATDMLTADVDLPVNGSPTVA